MKIFYNYLNKLFYLKLNLYNNLNNFKKLHSKIVFSGIQPTNVPHIGNYFGAINQWLNLQNNLDYKCIFFIADLHFLTIPFEQRIKNYNLKENTLKLLANLIACGLDTKKCLIFKQSDILEHAQLCWIISCTLTMDQLKRMPQFKDKTKNMKNIPIGLFLYPSMQAADILLYKSNYVPIGNDNLSNLYITQNIAKKFNTVYKNFFPIPLPLIQENTSCIRSLNDTKKKMSKSDRNSTSIITLIDSPDTIKKNIKKAITDFNCNVTYDEEKRPGVSNLILINSLIENCSIEKIVKDAKGLTTAQYKDILGQKLEEFIKPIRTKTLELYNDKLYLNSILIKGRNEAKQIATNTLNEVSKILGLK